MSSPYSYYPQSGMTSRRMIVLAVIVAVHAVLIYAFAIAFSGVGMRYVQTIFKTNIIQTQKIKDLPPPPPTVKLNTAPPVAVVAPKFAITVPVNTPRPITIVKRVVKAAPPPPPPPTVVSAPTASWPDTQDFYPPAAQRLNQEGRPVIRYCINARDQLTSVALAKSSSYPLLDQAAIQLVKAGQHFRGEQLSNGRTVAGCNELAVKFVLSSP